MSISGRITRQLACPNKDLAQGEAKVHESEGAQELWFHIITAKTDAQWWARSLSSWSRKGILHTTNETSLPRRLSQAQTSFMSTLAKMCSNQRTGNGINCLWLGKPPQRLISRLTGSAGKCGVWNKTLRTYKESRGDEYNINHNSFHKHALHAWARIWTPCFLYAVLY